MVLEQLTAQIFRHVSIKDEIIRRAILYWGHRKLDNKGRCWLAVFISKRPPNSPNLKRFKFIHWTITAETVRECNQRFLQQSSCIAFSFINELIGSLCKIRMESMLSILAIRTCSSSRFFQVSPCYIRCLSFFSFILSLSLSLFFSFFFVSSIHLFIFLSFWRIYINFESSPSSRPLLSRLIQEFSKLNNPTRIWDPTNVSDASIQSGWTPIASVTCNFFNQSSWSTFRLLSEPIRFIQSNSAGFHCLYRCL